MRILRIGIRFVFAAYFLSWIFIISDVLANTPYPQIEIPIYPSAKDLRFYSDESANITSKSYIVDIPYPASNIINFYNKEFEVRGLKACKDSHGSNEQWISYQDATGKEILYVRQFSQCWFSVEGGNKILLFLRYETSIPTKWNDNLLVICQIMPLRRDKDLNDFLKKLEKEGKLEDFLILLDRYTSPDKNIDFDKAIHENPNQPLLKEYYDLIKKMGSNN